jgi:hypothetical protein
MLSIRQPKSQIIERILRTKTGEYVRATFLVVEYQGQVKAKLLSAEPVAFEHTDFESTVVQALPAPITRAIFEVVQELKLESIVSPYSDFAFLMSQPTRAPSGNF